MLSRCLLEKTLADAKATWRYQELPPPGQLSDPATKLASSSAKATARFHADVASLRLRVGRLERQVPTPLIPTSGSSTLPDQKAVKFGCLPEKVKQPERLDAPGQPMFLPSLSIFDAWRERRSRWAPSCDAFLPVLERPLSPRLSARTCART